MSITKPSFAIYFIKPRHSKYKIWKNFRYVHKSGLLHPDFAHAELFTADEAIVLIHQNGLGDSVECGCAGYNGNGEFKYTPVLPIRGSSYAPKTVIHLPREKKTIQF